MNCCIIAYHCPKSMASKTCRARGRSWEQKEPPQHTLVSTDFSLHAESQRTIAQYRLRVCTYINVISTYSHCPLAHTTCTLEWGRPHTRCSPCKCRVLTEVGEATLPSGSHPLVVRLSVPESHESQRLLTPKDSTDSHQPHCHRQQCPVVTGEGLGEEGGGQERRMQGTQRGSVEWQHSLADTSAPNETTLHTFVSSCGVPCINIQTSRVGLGIGTLSSKVTTAQQHATPTQSGTTTAHDTSYCPFTCRL